MAKFKTGDIIFNKIYPAQKIIINALFPSGYSITILGMGSNMWYPDHVDIDDYYELVDDTSLYGVKATTYEEWQQTLPLVGKNKPQCSHSWKHYQGLSQEFDYCEKCDEKKT